MIKFLLMPVNRNALVRYRTIDNCLRNRYRKWTLEDLVEACSNALYEYEGIDKGVSIRTVQLDLQFMRSDKLGYNAPIIVVYKKYYTYEDPEYSITNIPLTEQDLNKLSEVIEILKQFKGFSHFQELSGMVQKLEDKVYTEKTKQQSVIQFETNENLKGLEFIDNLYKAIIKRCAVKLTYQSFKARNANEFDFHPQLLKEFRNRWFVLGFKGKNQNPLMLALDRVLKVKDCDTAFIENTTLNLQDYFRDVIGVSVAENGSKEEVEIFITEEHAPYILTKPMHHSQIFLRKLPGGIVISLNVQLNFELEKELLGYGETIKVLKPENLVRKIRKRSAMMHQLYTQDIHPVVATETFKRVDRRGFAVLDGIYSAQDISRIGQLIESKTKETDSFRVNKDLFAIRKLLMEIPELKGLLFNQKLYTLIKKGLGEKYFISKAIYFDKPPHSNWYVTWHQDVPINVREKKETEGFSGWTRKNSLVSVMPPEDIVRNIYTLRIHLDKTTAENGALQIIPKSHYKILKDQEIDIIRNEREPVTCEVEAGGIHFLKPLTLHASSKTTNNRARRVIHLEFASVDLPGRLEWLEKEEI